MSRPVPLIADPAVIDGAEWWFIGYLEAHMRMTGSIDLDDWNTAVTRAADEAQRIADERIPPGRREAHCPCGWRLIDDSGEEGAASFHEEADAHFSTCVQLEVE